MIDLGAAPTDDQLREGLKRFWPLSGAKIRVLAEAYDPERGSPVFTRDGVYTSQDWTEWTEGFEVGAAALQFDATGEPAFLELARQHCLARMTSHVTHFGVHDHGFNNVSTYGNLWRLMNEGRIPENPWERAFYEMALHCSGAVQAHRWTDLGEGRGYVYSFNGPHSLFSDTIRSMRSLALAHLLGEAVREERDELVSMLDRLVQHGLSTAEFNVYYGHGRDVYDLRGRVAHESVFDVVDGSYRCPSTQQGYSPFSTWTRGLAWVLTGYAEQLEFLRSLDDEDFEDVGEREAIEASFLEAATASADFYLEHTPPCGVPYWDTGAPGLAAMPDWRQHEADPDNPHEPVDSSAAAIACQGLVRLGRFLAARGEDGSNYEIAGRRVLASLLSDRYLALDEAHQGLLLHAVYHRPNGWDAGGAAGQVPRGESCMWGDYHLREAALTVQRLLDGGTPYTFFGAPERE